MQITRAADYAVRLMLQLAVTSEGRRASRQELARAGDAPLPFVAKLLQRLVSAGLVKSQPGRGGGFVLARGRDAISILDIVTAVDGDVCLNRCQPPISSCHRSSWCPAHPVWTEAQLALQRILSAATLDQLAAGMPCSAQMIPVAALQRAAVPELPA